MEEKQPLETLTYTISLEEYEKGFVLFQKRYVFPKNYIMTAAFAIVAALYILQIVENPAYSTAWVMLFVCLFFIALIWYNVFKIRKSLINSIKNIKEDTYVTNVYGDGLVISEKIPEEEISPENPPAEIPPKEISFSSDRPDVIENAEMFIIYIKKQMFYAIPKRCLSQQQEEVLRNALKEAKDVKFIDKLKKEKA